MSKRDLKQRIYPYLLGGLLIACPDQVWGIEYADWRERLVAVNHVDNTGRLQSVARDENPLYYDLIKAFEKKTGISVVLNTSFNENEPIVGGINAFKRKFTLKRSIWNYPALAAFHSKFLTQLFYLSGWAKSLHYIMYLFRKRPIEIDK